MTAGRPGDGALTLERFSALAEAYGGELERWPTALRPAASVLLADNPAAQGILDEARALDRMLEAAPPPQAPPELMAAILEDADPLPPRRWFQILWPGAPAWKPAAALCCAALLGLVIGLADDGSVYSDTALADQLEAVLYGDLPDDGDL